MAANVEKTTVNPLDLKDCPVDTSLGTDDPNNVFTCKTWEKCCTVALKPACCATPEMSDAIMDQVRLWGPLLGILVLLSLFIWWCRTDEACCDVEKPCLYRFGCKKYPKDREEHDSDSQDPSGSTVSLRSTKSSMTTVAEVDADNDNLENQKEQEEEPVAADQSAEKLEEKLDAHDEEPTAEETDEEK